MDNQFCKNCGQANFPNAATCTKCGNALSSIAGSQFGASNEPPPTMVANQQIPQVSAPKAEKKSNKMYWVIGIVAVLLIFFVGLIGIAGIGTFLYLNNQEVARDYPNDKPQKDDPTADTKDETLAEDDDSLSDIKFPPTDSSDGGMNDEQNTGNEKVTDAALIGFFTTQKSNVGKFKLQNVTATDDSSIFPNRIAGVVAKYASGSKRLTHNFAAYSSNSSLKDDFDEYKRKAKSSGGKVTNSTATSVIYIKGSLVYFAFYNPQGGLHEMSSRVGKDILKYHNDYFGVK